MQSVRLALVVLALASLAAAAVSSGGSYEDDNVQASMKALSNDVEIKLYTRHNTEKGQALSVDSPELLESSFFDPLQPTKIIVHGWLSDQTNNTGGDLIKDALLEVSPYNVILIDWSGADSPNYLTSRLQVPDLGRLVGKLIRQLAESAGLDYSDLHLIGHSLGAHVMGFAGRSAGLGDKGRITGIDPAGPLFWNDPSVRLDKTDAGFVDVIHTCTPTLGYVGPIGHVDYYPNGGAWVQPGCDFFQSACSHCRGYSLLIESIESPGAFIATACSSWWNYRNGKCKSNEQVELGLGTNREARGSFFFATNADPPYSQTASLPASDTLMLSKNILKC